MWWVAQFLKYMLRPQPHLEAMLQSTVTNFKLEHPIVGVHIRRTDKVGTEAAFHAVEEYMTHVLEWFRKQQLTNPEVKARVYVASDEPRVLGECRKKYPDVEFLGDQDVAKSAAVSSRWVIILLPIRKCFILNAVIQVFGQFLERSHPRHPPAVPDRLPGVHLQQPGVQDRVRDHAAEPRGRQQPLQVSGRHLVLRRPGRAPAGGHLQPHSLAPRRGDGVDSIKLRLLIPISTSVVPQIELKVGDVVGVAGNHWDGTNKGRNHRTNKVGLYPEYKTRERLRVVSFPTYDKHEL